MGCRLIQPHVGHFRIGVSAPGDGQGAEFFAPEKQGVLNDDAGGGVRQVGKLIGQADVAGGINAGIGGLQIIIDQHPPAAAGFILHPGGFQIEVFHIGSPAGAHQNLIHLDFSGGAATLEAEQFAGGGRRNLDRYGLEDEINPFP